jgi:hypothetical protein
MERHHELANVITATFMRTISTKLPAKASRLDVERKNLVRASGFRETTHVLDFSLHDTYVCPSIFGRLTGPLRLVPTGAPVSDNLSNIEKSGIVAR